MAIEHRRRLGAGVTALRSHWPEYALEAAELGAFMISACVFAVLLFHPASFVTQAIESTAARRVLMGLAMGLTLVGLVFSPAGQRSGAHMNPGVTLTFWRLGKVAGWDAVFYIGAQFIGGIAGVMVVGVFMRISLADESVRFAATLPGRMGGAGLALAWIGEFTISFILLTTILNVSNHRRLTRFTGLFAGALVAMFIMVEDPISGMSMNPARTFGSALAADLWTGLWIYFTAPPLAMLAAAEVYIRRAGLKRVYCAKLHHCNDKRCIFRCEFGRLMQPSDDTPSTG